MRSLPIPRSAKTNRTYSGLPQSELQALNVHSGSGVAHGVRHTGYLPAGLHDKPAQQMDSTSSRKHIGGPIYDCSMILLLCPVAQDQDQDQDKDALL